MLRLDAPLNNRPLEQARRRRRRRRRRRNLFAQNTFTINYKLAIGLSECNNIRKLNKNHLGKVPSKAASSLKLKGPYNIYI